MGRTIAAMVTGILMLPACAEPSPQSTSITVRDSAGVRIVELPSISMIEARFVVSDSPVYRVGWREDEHDFHNIVAGGLWPDGRAVVGEGGAPLQVVMLSTTGAVDAVLGRPGSGPGEFSGIFAVLPLGGDTVVVQDHYAGRATIFAGRDVVGTVGLGPVVHRILGRDRGGGFLMGPPLARTPTPTRAYETAWLSVPLLRFNPATGAADTLAWTDWDQSMALGGNSPFASGGWASVSDGAFVTGRSDRPELRWYESAGRIRHITRWRDEPQPVTDDVLAAWEVARRARYVELGLPVNESRISTIKAVIREPLPFFGFSGSMPGLFGASGLVSDPDGNVWIASYLPSGDSSPRQYYIMSPQGQWLGWAEMPEAFRVLAIGRDRVLGVERNALDVQAVALYEVQRPRQRPK